MNMTEQAVIRSASADDFNAVVQLLQAENLPTEDLKPDLPHFFVAVDAREVVGLIGLEIYDDAGLLRSMVVERDYRNRSIAKNLLSTLLHYAAEKQVRYIYLITTTAEMYFASKGFSVLNRDQVPASISSCQEFSTLCPTTATVMRKIVN